MSFETGCRVDFVFKGSHKAHANLLEHHATSSFKANVLLMAFNITLCVISVNQTKEALWLPKGQTIPKSNFWSLPSAASSLRPTQKKGKPRRKYTLANFFANLPPLLVRKYQTVTYSQPSSTQHLLNLAVCPRQNFCSPMTGVGPVPKLTLMPGCAPPAPEPCAVTVFWVKTQLKSKKSLSRGSRRKSKPESWGPLIFQSQEYPTQMLEDVLCKGTTFGMVTWHGQLKGRHTFQETRMQAACVELSQHDTHVHRCTLLVSHMIASGMRYAAHMQHG